MVRHPKRVKNATSLASSRSRASRNTRATSPSPRAKATAIPSATTLLNQSRETTDEWYRSPRTKKSYSSYVKSGKSWLKDWVASSGDDDGAGSNAEGDERMPLADAFDVLSAQTPIALRILTACNCDHGGCGFSTAEGLRSAFKQYFEWFVTFCSLCW